MNLLGFPPGGLYAVARGTDAGRPPVGRGPQQAPAQVGDRLLPGYLFYKEVPELAALVGQDVTRNTVSWGRGAGAILATTADMTRWERALYGGKLLPPKQQAELESLVSEATGEPIETTSPENPFGFGLGVSQVTTPALGTVWAYLGEAFASRAFHGTSRNLIWSSPST